MMTCLETGAAPTYPHLTPLPITVRPQGYMTENVYLYLMPAEKGCPTCLHTGPLLVPLPAPLVCHWGLTGILFAHVCV